MRITNRGVMIDQIFSADDGEFIEISADGGMVNVKLLNNTDGQLTEHFFTSAMFRELLSAMNAADQELIKIEQASRPVIPPMVEQDEVAPADSSGDWREGR